MGSEKKISQVERMEGEKIRKGEDKWKRAKGVKGEIIT